MPSNSNDPVPSLSSASPASCIYCGAVQTITRDHVPPKCMFPHPRPLDTVTVPACRQCNVSYQKDDEHFTIAMAAVAYSEDPDARQVWQSTIRPMLRRSVGFRRMLSQGIVPGPVRTAEGIVLPNRVAIKFSAPRIGRVVERIVRGLLWHHYGVMTTASTELLVFRGQDVPPDVAQIINTSTTTSWIGGSIFRYRHGVASDGRDSSLWALQFYTRADFIVIVQGDSFLNAERTQTLPDSTS